MARKDKLSGGKNGRPYSTDIGFVEGQKSQPRFYLGTAEREAELRRRRLEDFWDSVTAAGYTHWTPFHLDIAHTIRQGRTEYEVPLPDEREWEWSVYFDYVRTLATTYRGITFVPTANAESKTDVTGTTATATEFFQAGHRERVRDWEEKSAEAKRLAEWASVPAKRTGHSFHSTLDDFAKRVRETMLVKSADPAKRVTSRSGRVLAEHVLRLKDCHADIPVEDIDLEAIERMANYWKARPAAKTHSARKKAKAIAPDTAVNHVKALRRYVKFLGRERTRYGWAKVEDAADVMKVDRMALLFEDEHADLAHGPETFSLGDLTTMYRDATDIRRFILLLGLNMGFAESEMNSFRWSEIVEERGRHYVRRIRRKTGVYCEFELWPDTVRALKWWREANGGWEYVFSTGAGKRTTERKLANNWAAFLKTVRANSTVPALPLKYLRKTAAQLMIDRSEADEITVGIFQGRGKPVATDFQADKYYRRRFSRVFEALGVVRDYLAPMFAAAPVDAFTGPARKRGGNPLGDDVAARVRAMGASGQTVSEIARELGLSRPTVYRHL